MTLMLYREEDVQATIDAYRGVTGSTAPVKMGQMPGLVAGLLAKGRREVWLHGPKQRQGALFIDTGVAGDMTHTLEVIGYGNIYASTVLFGSVTSAGSRQVVDVLTSTNKIRFAWGNSGLKTYEYPIETWTPWLPFKVRFDRSGFTLEGFTNGFAAMTESGDYAASVTGGASTANYKVFPQISSASGGGAPGVFRSAKVFDASSALLHHFVPVLYGDWSLALLDKVTGNEIALPSGAAGYGAQWEPYHDELMGLTA